MTLREARQLYHQKALFRIRANRERWRTLGLLAEERALLAWAIRRDARVETRQDIGAHWRLVFEARDLVVYGHVNGPEFSLELRQAKEKGLTGDAVYEEVIDSACRTSEKFDEWSRP